MKFNDKKIESLTKEIVIKLIFSVALATFWVIFIWNFWDKGIYALGLNAFVFTSLLSALLIKDLDKKKKLTTNDLTWIIPLGLIVLSFLIYDNPFLKVISILIYTFSFGGFINYALLSNKKSVFWNFQLFSKIFKRFFSFFEKISESALLHLELIIPANQEKRRIIAKIIFGIILFLVIAVTIFIPLLSSADHVFASKIQIIYNFIKYFFVSSTIYNKIIFAIILSITIFSALLAWNKKFDYEEKEEASKNVDPIISGIVIGGIFILYLLFLTIQLKYLLIKMLPLSFEETENLVKSGFWQLLFLSLINIVIYFFTYKKTNRIVQGILTAFTIASSLLLLSAAYRMSLYAIFYGLSYEKFFALYTVIYCAILFVWLIFRMFVRKKANIVKFLVLLFFWMYAMVTIMPVEQIILRTNIKLSYLSQSRIKLQELIMLSPDVLALVQKYKNKGMLNDTEWDLWMKNRIEEVRAKKWYEYNISNIIYLNK